MHGGDGWVERVCVSVVVCEAGNRLEPRTQPRGLCGRHQQGAGRGLGRLHRLHRAFVERQRHGDALFGGSDIAILTLDADEVATKPLGNRAGGASAKEGIEDDVAGVRAG